jgi:tol-pal system protein YbgF
MPSSFHSVTCAAALAAGLALCSSAFAQSDDQDPELRIQRLENQLRQLTGQNEELQFRNRQLEERLRQLQGGAQPAPGAPPAEQPSVAVAPPIQLDPGYRQQGAADQGYAQPQAQPGGYAQPQQPGYAQPQPGYGQPQGGYGQPQIASPAPIVQEQPPASPQGRRRGDAFDPNQNPNAPGAPQGLGGGRLPMPAEGAAPGPRGAGQVDQANIPGSRPPPGGPPPQANPNAAGALATAPPTNTPRDEYDLGIGYMQRKDYALAEQTMRNFAEKYPSDPLIGDSQYWLGESLYQRQQYRDAAEVFLAVTTKYDKSAKAPDSLLRLGESLAALKEKEAACAAFGEVGRKYPRASASVKAAVDRDQKRVKC